MATEHTNSPEHPGRRAFPDGERPDVNGHERTSADRARGDVGETSTHRAKRPGAPGARGVAGRRRPCPEPCPRPSRLATGRLVRQAASGGETCAGMRGSDDPRHGSCAPRDGGTVASAVRRPYSPLNQSGSTVTRSTNSVFTPSPSFFRRPTSCSPSIRSMAGAPSRVASRSASRVK